MRVWWLLLLVAGCDGVFGLPHVYTHADAIADDALVGEADARPGCTIDRFADGLDGVLTRWYRFANSTGFDIDVEGSELVAKLPQNATGGYAWADLIGQRDLLGATVSVETTAIAAAGPTADTYFTIAADQMNLYIFEVYQGLLYLRVMVGGIKMYEVSQPYDPPTLRFWRFLHDPVASRVRFYTSSNGSDWIMRHDIPTVVPIGQMVIELGAGIGSAGQANPTEARWDNFELCHP